MGSLLSIGFTYNAQAASVDETRDIYKEYISIRKLIGEEESSWASQKLALADMIAVVETEIEQTKEIISTLESSATSADTQKADLQEELEQAKRASAEFNSIIETYEERVSNIVLKLPDVLQAEIQPLVSRLPDDAQNTRLTYSQRLQTVIGLLAQIEKFNSDLRTVTEVKDLEGGSHEVSTLYFGLASALFSNSAGTYAGYGKPGEDGWTWTTVTGLEAESITAAIDIYAARRAPAFVSVPMVID